ERSDQLLGPEGPGGALPALELVEEPRRGGERAQVEPRGLPRRRRLEAVRGAEHRDEERADARERRRRLAERAECHERRLAQPFGLLDDALGRLDRPPPEPALDVVDARAGEARVRGAEECEELLAAAPRPREPEQRRERVADRRRAEASPHLDRVRDAEAPEGGLERRPEALRGGHDERDLLRDDAVAEEREHLARDELERVPGARAPEEAHRARGRERPCRRAFEERPLEVCERRRRVLR